MPTGAPVGNRRNWRVATPPQDAILPHNQPYIIAA
jgi:hypothetical protein